MVGRSPTHRSYILTISLIASFLVVLVSYLWLVSYGTWTHWVSRTNYYDQMATAFQHGSLELETKPDPALLALPNPYNPNKRSGINYPLDVSLYEGKFYFYFGPVPAILMLVFKFLGVGLIGDEILVFIFISGIVIAQALLVIKFREAFFPDIPAWSVPVCILFCGLVSPWTWMVSEARIYEAAGAAAQFFFLLGLYFNFVALMKKTSTLHLVMGGVSWALTLGSRITQVIPIGFVSLWIVIFLIKNKPQTMPWSKTFAQIFALGMPMAIGVSLLGLYNWVRFDSFFETGFSYQLTTLYLQKYSHVLFSPLYILPNLYEYVLAPPKFTFVFPFLQSVRGKAYLIFTFIDLPAVYYTRAVTGMLFTNPFALFAGVSICLTFVPGKARIDDKFHHPMLKWVVIGLAGSFLIGFAAVLSFFWVVTRYLADAIPALILLSILGFWQGYQRLKQRTVIRYIYSVMGIGLMLASIMVSNLVMLSARAEVFRSANPALWEQLVRLFSP